MEALAKMPPAARGFFEKRPWTPKNFCLEDEENP